MPKITLQWRRGPTGDILIDAHDRSINCLSLFGDEIVTGSSDHGLKVIDVPNAKIKRELFSKDYGHHEWVTCCDHLEDGRLLSGGMDSQLCLWDRNSVSCESLRDHHGSISQVKCGENNIGVSSSYDKTVKIWDLDEPKCLYTLRDEQSGHTKAVQRFVWENSLLVSGGRDSLCCIWDVNRGKHVNTLEEHTAPIQSLNILSHSQNNVLVTGAMDGYVCIWDLRTCELVQKTSVKSSVNDIKISDPQEHQQSSHPYPQIVVGNADKTIRILDMKKDFKVRAECHGHKDVVTTICLVNDLILSGGGNGWVLVHDMMKGNCLYGVGVTETGGCTAIKVMPPKHFIAAGEDGKCVIFSY